MAVLSLPLTFTNSFWSQDYRRGLHVLYDKLEQVCSYFCFDIEGHYDNYHTRASQRMKKS